WMIESFQKPGHMGIIESQTMEMTVEPPAGAMPVALATVERKPFASSVTYTGSAVAYNDIPIYPRTEGWITALSVYPGDRVKKGQVLAQLNTDEQSARLSEAQYQQAEAQESIRSSKANLDYWRNKIERARALVKEEVITREEFEEEQSQYEAAESAYAQTLSRLNATSANTRIQSIIRGYTTVKAPMSGVITERSVPPGTLASPGMQILKLAQLQPLRIQANIAESDAGRIKVGMPVRIVNPRDKKAKPIESRVSAVFPVASLQTRTSVVEAVIPNEDERLVPGDYVVVEVEMGQKETALVIPNEALIAKDTQTAVWVVEEGKAFLKYVTTGESNGKETEVIDGLKEGEQVVTQGYQDLQNGVAVIAGDYGPQGLKSLPKTTASNRLSSENGYSLKRSIEHQVVLIALTPKPPKAGDNELTVEVSSAHGEISRSLDLEVKTVMPAMPSMINPEPSVKKMEAGKFRVKVKFIMPGLWQMNLTLKDGGKVVGQLQVDVKVPE
ncbi:MAG: efflux RND transporter periplasmic adaptor subunit, partial [Nitrospiraceae bacterium]